MKLQRVPSPAAEHRRQMIWQVWVPLSASILIVLGLIGMTIAGALLKSNQVERWGNLSTVWVILPVLFVGLIFLAIIIACVYGMSKLLIRMPGWMLKLQMGVVHIGQIIRRAADISTRPVMTVNGVQARMETVRKRIFGK